MAVADQRDPADPAISVEGLSVRFGRDRPAPDQMLAVDDVSFTAGRGEVVCIVGPSGCGKSTVLNVIAGMVQPGPMSDVELSGRFRLLTKEQRRNRQIGYMFQQDTLLPWRTALENVVLPLQLQGRPDAIARASALLDLTGLGQFGHRYPKELSGGMRKRVQMAQVLAQDPEILLMDEPFGALDAQTKALMQQEFIRAWERDRKTIIFVTHDLTEAILLGDRILSMSARPGRVKREFVVDIERPRTIQTLVGHHRYAELHRALWSDLEAEAYQTLRAVPAAPKGGAFA